MATLSAIDPDSSEFTFSLIADETGLFQVRGDQLALTELVDFENLPQGFFMSGDFATASLTIEVEDEAGNTFMETLTITVNNLAEFVQLAERLRREFPEQARVPPASPIARCDNVLKALVDKSAVSRCYAALALSSLVSDVAFTAVESMERSLQSGDRREVKQTLEAFVPVSKFLTTALPALVDVQGDWDPSVKVAARGALQAIAMYADRTVELLKGLARDPDASIARSSVRVLGNLGIHAYGRENAHEEIVGALRHPDFSVRYHAGRGLLLIDEEVKAVAAAAGRGELDSEEDIRRLTQALQDSPVRREGAVNAFWSIGSEADGRRDELSQALRIGDSNAKAEAVKKLGDVSLFVTRPLPTLVEAPEVQQRVAADQAPPDLHAMLTVPDLVEALEDEDTRLATAQALRDVGATATTVSADLGYLRAEASDREARMVANDVLSSINVRSDDAVVALLDAMKKGSDQPVDASVVLALGYLGSLAKSDTRTDAVVALVDVLQGGSPEMRPYAAAALGQIEGERSVATLMQALKEGDRLVQYESAQALGRLRVEAAIPELREAVKGEDVWLRFHGVRALRQIDPAFEASSDELQDVFEAVDAEFDGAVDELVKGVARRDPAAARMLHHIGPPAVTAFPQLLALLREARTEDKKQIEALIRTVQSRVLPTVQAVIDDLETDRDPASRAGAARTLGEMGERAATLLPALTDQLGGPDMPPRPDGVQALSEIGATTAAAIRALLVAALTEEVEEVEQAARASLRRYALAASKERQLASR